MKRARTLTAARRAGWLWLAALALAAGCGSRPETAERRYHLDGVVVGVDRTQNHLVIDHKEIVGFMAAMAMPFPVADPADLDRVAIGDHVTADVVVDDSGARLENIVVVGKGELPGGGETPGQPPAGERAPNFVFLNQDGRQIGLGDFRGKAVVLTFLYTRCPYSDQCPRMSENFAEIARTLETRPELYEKTHLLSVSFDPGYDTPEILRSYGRYYVGDRGFDHWDFAAVRESDRRAILSFFNIFYLEEHDQITHSLNTVLIAPDGTLHKWYRSNEWKPADVVRDITALLAPQS